MLKNPFFVHAMVRVFYDTWSNKVLYESSSSEDMLNKIFFQHLYNAPALQIRILSLGLNVFMSFKMVRFELLLLLQKK